MNLFLFGTLQDPELLSTVLGRDAVLEQAQLSDHAVALVKNAAFPMLVRRAGDVAQGIILRGLDDTDLARLDFYEAPFGYARQGVDVTTNAGMTQATVYVPRTTLEPDGDWSLSHWQHDIGPVKRQAAREIMYLFGRATPDDIKARLGQIETRAQARVNATQGSVVKLRTPHTRCDVEQIDYSQAYAQFFTVDEIKLRHRRFSGEISAPIERAVFVSADAVTVLPYDPVRDRVLLIEQFRAGPYLRGDPVPWSLEVIAGRIDAFETAEQAARREAREEAGLVLGDLHLAGRYYSSPGAKTEYLTSFIALIDLPDDVAGIGGLDTEAEDIRSMIVSFDALMDALDTGEAENAPLMICAFWLARHRARLRG